MHDKIKAIAATWQEAKGQIQTEEATKNALIMPFIAALGYNVFNPLEVIPEFDAGVAGKKGEKVDYAIKINDDQGRVFQIRQGQGQPCFARRAEAKPGRTGGH